MKILEWKYLKAVSGLLALIFSVNTIAWSAPASPSINMTEAATSRMEVRTPSLAEQLELPETLGKIESRSVSTSQAPSIIHIQEAHNLYEGQIRVEETLDYLAKRYPLDLILVEGAFTKLDGTLTKYYKDPKDNLEMSERLTREGFFGGVERFLLKRVLDEKKPVEAYGIEEPELYQKNLKEFQTVRSQSEMTSKFLSEFRTKIGTLASKTLKKELKTFFLKYLYFQEKHDGLDAYLELLRKETKKQFDFNLSNARQQFEWPQLVRYFKLKLLEKQLDSEKAEVEKKELIENLKQRKDDGTIGRQDEEKKEIVRSSSRPFVHRDFIKCLEKPETACFEKVSGRKGYGAVRLFYEKLYEIQRKDERTIGRQDEENTSSFHPFVHRPSDLFKTYPEYTKQIGIQILSNEMIPQQLFGEIEKLSTKLLEKLAKTESEKKVLSLFEDYQILKKLFALELTPNEYERIAYSVERLGSHQKSYPLSAKRYPLLPSKMIERLDTLARINLPDAIKERKQIAEGKKKSSGKPKSNKGLWNLNRTYAEALSFYTTAHKREEVMKEGIAKRIKETGKGNVALITGGFHTKGLSSLLTSEGYSYVSVLPSIGNITEKTGYDKVMASMAVIPAKAGIQALDPRQNISGMTMPNASHLIKPSLAMGAQPFLKVLPGAGNRLIAELKSSGFVIDSVVAERNGISRTALSVERRASIPMSYTHHAVLDTQHESARSAAVGEPTRPEGRSEVRKSLFGPSIEKQIAFRMLWGGVWPTDSEKPFQTLPVILTPGASPEQTKDIAEKVAKSLSDFYFQELIPKQRANPRMQLDDFPNIPWKKVILTLPMGNENNDSNWEKLRPYLNAAFDELKPEYRNSIFVFNLEGDSVSLRDSVLINRIFEVNPRSILATSSPALYDSLAQKSSSRINMTGIAVGPSEVKVMETGIPAATVLAGFTPFAPPAPSAPVVDESIAALAPSTSNAGSEFYWFIHDLFFGGSRLVGSLSVGGAPYILNAVLGLSLSGWILIPLTMITALFGINIFTKGEFWNGVRSLYAELKKPKLAPKAYKSPETPQPWKLGDPISIKQLEFAQTALHQFPQFESLRKSQSLVYQKLTEFLSKAAYEKAYENSLDFNELLIFYYEFTVHLRDSMDVLEEVLSLGDRLNAVHRFSHQNGRPVMIVDNRTGDEAAKGNRRTLARKLAIPSGDYAAPEWLDANYILEVTGNVQFFKPKDLPKVFKASRALIISDRAENLQNDLFKGNRTLEHVFYLNPDHAADRAIIEKITADPSSSLYHFLIKGPNSVHDSVAFSYRDHQFVRTWMRWGLKYGLPWLGSLGVAVVLEPHLVQTYNLQPNGPVGAFFMLLSLVVLFRGVIDYLLLDMIGAPYERLNEFLTHPFKKSSSVARSEVRKDRISSSAGRISSDTNDEMRNTHDEIRSEVRGVPVLTYQQLRDPFRGFEGRSLWPTRAVFSNGQINIEFLIPAPGDTDTSFTKITRNNITAVAHIGKSETIFGKEQNFVLVLGYLDGTFEYLDVSAQKMVKVSRKQIENDFPSAIAPQLFPVKKEAVRGGFKAFLQNLSATPELKWDLGAWAEQATKNWPDAVAAKKFATWKKSLHAPIMSYGVLQEKFPEWQFRNRGNASYMTLELDDAGRTAGQMTIHWQGRPSITLNNITSRAIVWSKSNGAHLGFILVLGYLKGLQEKYVYLDSLSGKLIPISRRQILDRFPAETARELGFEPNIIFRGNESTQTLSHKLHILNQSFDGFLKYMVEFEAKAWLVVMMFLSIPGLWATTMLIREAAYETQTLDKLEAMLFGTGFSLFLFSLWIIVGFVLFVSYVYFMIKNRHAVPVNEKIIFDHAATRAALDMIYGNRYVRSFKEMRNEFSIFFSQLFQDVISQAARVSKNIKERKLFKRSEVRSENPESNRDDLPTVRDVLRSSRSELLAGTPHKRKANKLRTGENFSRSEAAGQLYSGLFKELGAAFKAIAAKIENSKWGEGKKSENAIDSHHVLRASKAELLTGKKWLHRSMISFRDSGYSRTQAQGEFFSKLWSELPVGVRAIRKFLNNPHIEKEPLEFVSRSFWGKLTVFIFSVGFFSLFASIAFTLSLDKLTLDVYIIMIALWMVGSVFVTGSSGVVLAFLYERAMKPISPSTDGPTSKGGSNIFVEFLVWVKEKLTGISNLNLHQVIALQPKVAGAARSEVRSSASPNVAMVRQHILELRQPIREARKTYDEFADKGPKEAKVIVIHYFLPAFLTLFIGAYLMDILSNYSLVWKLVIEEESTLRGLFLLIPPFWIVWPAIKKLGFDYGEKRRLGSIHDTLIDQRDTWHNLFHSWFPGVALFSQFERRPTWKVFHELILEATKEIETTLAPAQAKHFREKMEKINPKLITFRKVLLSDEPYADASWPGTKRDPVVGKVNIAETPQTVSFDPIPVIDAMEDLILDLAALRESRESFSDPDRFPFELSASLQALENRLAAFLGRSEVRCCSEGQPLFQTLFQEQGLWPFLDEVRKPGGMYQLQEEIISGFLKFSEKLIFGVGALFVAPFVPFVFVIVKVLEKVNPYIPEALISKQLPQLIKHVNQNGGWLTFFIWDTPLKKWLVSAERTMFVNLEVPAFLKNQSIDSSEKLVAQTLRADQSAWEAAPGQTPRAIQLIRSVVQHDAEKFQMQQGFDYTDSDNLLSVRGLLNQFFKKGDVRGRYETVFNEMWNASPWLALVAWVGNMEHVLQFWDWGSARLKPNGEKYASDDDYRLLQRMAHVFKDLGIVEQRAERMDDKLRSGETQISFAQWLADQLIEYRLTKDKRKEVAALGLFFLILLKPASVRPVFEAQPDLVKIFLENFPVERLDFTSAVYQRINKKSANHAAARSVLDWLQTLSVYQSKTHDSVLKPLEGKYRTFKRLTTSHSWKTLQDFKRSGGYALMRSFTKVQNGENVFATEVQPRLKKLDPQGLDIGDYVVITYRDTTASHRSESFAGVVAERQGPHVYVVSPDLITDAMINVGERVPTFFWDTGPKVYQKERGKALPVLFPVTQLTVYSAVSSSRSELRGSTRSASSGSNPEQSRMDSTGSPFRSELRQTKLTSERVNAVPAGRQGSAGLTQKTRTLAYPHTRELNFMPPTTLAAIEQYAREAGVGVDMVYGVTEIAQKVLPYTVSSARTTTVEPALTRSLVRQNILNPTVSEARTSLKKNSPKAYQLWEAVSNRKDKIAPVISVENISAEELSSIFDLMLSLLAPSKNLRFGIVTSDISGIRTKWQGFLSDKAPELALSLKDRLVIGSERSVSSKLSSYEVAMIALTNKDNLTLAIRGEEPKHVLGYETITGISFETKGTAPAILLEAVQLLYFGFDATHLKPRTVNGLIALESEAALPASLAAVQALKSMQQVWSAA